MSSSAISVLFVANGLDSLKSAIGGVQAALDALAKGTKATTETAAKASTASATAGVKAYDKAEREKTQAMKREQRAREQELKAAERAELNFIKAGMSAVSAAERERTEAAKQGARDRLRVAEDEHRKQQALIQTRARMAGSMVGGAVNRTMGTVGRLAATAAAVGGGFSMVDSLRQGMSLEATAGEVVRGADITGGKTKRDVLEATRATAITTGGQQEDLLSGLNEFVKKTGDLQSALAMFQDLARYSTATGTSFHDMAGAAAEVFTKLRDVGQTKEVMLALAGQGRKGAIDLRDLAAYGARLAGTAGDYAGDRKTNIVKLGALAQIAKDAGLAPDAAEAATAVERLDSDLTKHAGNFKPGTVYDASGKKKGINEILTSALLQTGGDERQLVDSFGERSYKVVSGLRQVFVEAGGGQKGAAAVNAQFEKYGAGAALTEGQVSKDLADALTENERQVNIAMTKMSAAFQDKLLPLMPDLIDRFSRLIPYIEKFLDFLISNPWTGIGGLVGGAIVADIAKAAIGQAVGGALTGLIARLLGGGAAGAVAGTAGAVIGTGEAIATGATAGEVATGAAAGGGLAAALGSLILAVPSVFQQIGASREKASADTLAKTMALPEGTDEEKHAKYARVTELIDKGNSRAGEADAYQAGGAGDILLASVNQANEPYRRAMADLTREAELLRHGFSVAADAAQQLASNHPPRTREPTATHAP